MLQENIIFILIIIDLTFRVLGIIHSMQAILHAKSSQGTIAWVISLIIFPYLTVPLFWIFGKWRFQGYAERIDQLNHHMKMAVKAHKKSLSEHQAIMPAATASLDKVLEDLTQLHFTRGNSCQLLINGDQTFACIKAALEQAKHYILLQFYIVRNDELGNEIKETLIQAAKRQVKVYFIYDEIGCYHLAKSFINDLRQQGIAIHAFSTTKGRGNRFQINFRNHRKIVIVDGVYGFVGGLNLGDEYMGRDAHFGPWRDTFLKLQGPAVQQLSISFKRDWQWATGLPVEDNWQVATQAEDQTVGIMATGPADDKPSALLLITHMINMAKTRLWIASPYFVPEQTIISALTLATLRGVDVRIILPQKCDHFLVYWCAFAYYDTLKEAGVKLYRYREGFMHQKIILVDDKVAAVGTTNLDTRSIRLNFEVMALMTSDASVQQVEKMLEQDFNNCNQQNLDVYSKFPYWKRVMIRLTKLFEPIL